MTEAAKTHEGEDLALVFCDQFKSKNGTARRMQAERKASRTIKEKARRATRTAVVNFRTTPDGKNLAARLAKHLGISVGKMFDVAVLELAKREKLELDK